MLSHMLSDMFYKIDCDSLFVNIIWSYHFFFTTYNLSHKTVVVKYM